MEILTRRYFSASQAEDPDASGGERLVELANTQRGAHFRIRAAQDRREKPQSSTKNKKNKNEHLRHSSLATTAAADAAGVDPRSTVDEAPPLSASQASHQSTSGSSSLLSPLLDAGSTTDTVGVDPELATSTLQPNSMGSRSSISDGNGAFQSTHTVISIIAGLATCVLLVACVVLYKRKTSLSTLSGRDHYRGYCPSPFDPTRGVHRASSCGSPRNDDHPSMALSGDVTPTTITFGEDELSSSYRTCSRHYSERISSETSWAMTSGRSIELSGTTNKIDTVIPGSQANQPQRMNRVAMDSFLSDDDDGQDSDQARTRARDNSDSSSELFSTCMESERSSVASWSLSSSWSGSDVSSLESTRATDVSLSEYSISGSSRSFRISLDVDEDDLPEDDQVVAMKSEKDNEPRLPEATTTAASVATQSPGPESRCDSLLLFKPIKPRLFRSKPKKLTVQQSAANQEEEAKDEPQVWYC